MKRLILILIILLIMLSISNAKDIKRTKQTHKLHGKLVDLGFNKENAYIVIDGCKYAELKDKKVNAKRCIIMATAISQAESTMCNNALRNNCWGFRNKSFRSVRQAFGKWIKSYGKYWYKHTHPTQFITKSRYCTDEVSSGSSNGCPNWIKNTTKIFNILNN